MTWTPAVAIELYVRIREEKRLRKAAFEAEDTDDQGKLDLLENYLLGEMIARGEDQIKVNNVGVAYKSPQLRATMTDRADDQFICGKTLARIQRMRRDKTTTERI